MKRITEKDIVDPFFGLMHDFICAMKSVSDKTKGATEKRPVKVGGRYIRCHLDLEYYSLLDTFMLAYIIRELDRIRSDVKKISEKIGDAK